MLASIPISSLSISFELVVEDHKTLYFVRYFVQFSWKGGRENVYEKQVLIEAFLEMIKNSEYCLSLLRTSFNSFLFFFFRLWGWLVIIDNGNFHHL